MRVDHPPMGLSDSEKIQWLENMLHRYSERIHKLECNMQFYFCCIYCQEKRASGKEIQRYFFGKEYWSNQEHGRYETGILKLAKDDKGAWQSTYTSIDSSGYTCFMGPASDSLVQTMSYPGSKWKKCHI